VGGEVLGPEVGLDLDQPAGQAAAVDLADEELAEEVARYR